MALWWLLFGWQQIERLSEFVEPGEILRQQRMWLLEGVTLVVLVILGAFGLMALVLREKRRTQTLREFYSIVAHDVKTSLSSIRLKAESLAEKLEGRSQEMASTLVDDSVRLELHMENALILSSESDAELHFEQVDLCDLFARLRIQWPQLVLQIQGNGHVWADVRALKGIFSNLLHNSYEHGQATQIDVNVTTGERAVRMTVTDNGHGDGSAVHHGSGLGLKLAKQLAKKMNGDLQILNVDKGYSVALELEKADEVAVG